MPWWSSFSDSGVQGDATQGTAAKGKALYEGAVKELAGFVTEMRSMAIRERKDHHGD